MELVRGTGILVLLTFVCVHVSLSAPEAERETDYCHGKTCPPLCGNQTFNPSKSTCCEVQGKANLTTLLSQDVSKCCGLQAYNPLNEICCESVVITMPTAKAECCDRKVFDVDSQLCCGKINEKIILNKQSPEHRCCGRDQFHQKKQVCLEVNETLLPFDVPSEAVQMNPRSKHSQHYQNYTEPFGHLCCGANGSKVMLTRKSAQHRCCGQDQFNPDIECCCEKNHNLLVKLLSECQEFCREGVQNELIQNVTNIDSSVENLCCGPNGSKVMLPRSSPHHQCCGRQQFNSVNESCICLNETDSWHVHHQELHPSECKQQNKCSTKNHCCGNQVYNPSSHICCNGRSHAKGNNIQCCGTEAYDIRSPLLKCCMGSLYNVTSKPALCCGSTLQKKEETCCISENKQLLYSTKEGLQCCGHLYYNTSLWSCCLGKLTPQQLTGSKKQTKGCPLVPINNLEEWKLCNKITLGKVESVSMNSIVFSNVVKMYARGPLIYFQTQQVTISKSPGDCIFTELTSGKVYFFHGTDVYINLDHKSMYEALYFILSICQDYIG